MISCVNGRSVAWRTLWVMIWSLCLVEHAHKYTLVPVSDAPTNWSFLLKEKKKTICIYNANQPTLLIKPHESLQLPLDFRSVLIWNCQVFSWKLPQVLFETLYSPQFLSDKKLDENGFDFELIESDESKTFKGSKRSIWLERCCNLWLKPWWGTEVSAGELITACYLVLLYRWNCSICM